MNFFRKIKKFLISPETTKILKFLLDEFLPPILRDQRWFFGPIVKIFNARMDIDFKRKAPFMSEKEFQAAYENVAQSRETDMTMGTIEWVLENLFGKNILEVGSGNGIVSIACAKKGLDVTALDLAKANFDEVRLRAKTENVKIKLKTANIENLPFKNKEFDTTLCLHTLEHVRNLPEAIHELKRVTKKRLILVVPRQRYYLYTCDYHLNFFGNSEQLILVMKIKNAQCRIIDGSLCYLGDISN